jgi:hypothetical protein
VITTMPPPRVFSFDPENIRAEYAEQGWVHIKDAIDPEFFEYLRDFTEQQLAVTKLDRFAIKGKKEQSLFEFPDGKDYLPELFDIVSTVTGLNRPTMTLSERHIQAYEPHADPNPVAHKDRFPSQVSIGFSVAIPQGSQLVLYPEDFRELNPFNAAAALRRRLQPHEKPETVLPAGRELVLNDEEGDVVMFPGSTTWHLRRNAGNTVNLYLKMNDFDCDPLGEDPATTARRERTLQLLADDRGALGEHRPKLTRRLDYIGRQSARPDGEETLHYALYGDEPLGLTDTQLELLRAADGTQSLDSLIVEIANGGDTTEVHRDALVLIQDGGLDLLG